MATRAGIYVRISVDRDRTAASPERQLQDARRLCEAKGWDVAHTYEDRDVSAYKDGVKRPEYERMLSDVESGNIDAIVIWKLDRLSRSIAQLAPLLKKLDSNGVTLASVNDSIDTDSSMGKAMVQIAGVFAELESDTIGTRVKRAHLQAAEQGKWHSGGYRTFGYNRDGTIVESEANLIHEAVARIAEGESLWGICADWRDRLIKTTAGNDWRTNSLSQLLRSPTIAGFRRLHGKTYPGTWPPILPLEQFRSVNDQLNKGNRMSERRVRRHLLTGLIYCGRCGHKLNRRIFTQGNGKKFERYQCVSEPGKPNCGKIAASMISTNDLVSERTLARYLQLQPSTITEVEEQNIAKVQAAISAYSESMDGITKERYVDLSLSAELYEELKAKLQDNIRLLQDELSQLTSSTELRSNIPDDAFALEQWWEDADHETKRTLIEQVVEKITINPAVRKGGNKFDTNRVAINWK